MACVFGLLVTLAQVHAGPQIRNHLARIVSEGEPSLYLSGYAYHRRDRYSPGLLRLLNEESWGVGFGRTLRLKDSGVASLALTAFQDSLGEWEYNLGYLREWRSTPRRGRPTLGAGVSAFLTSRSDFFAGRPFPGVLPLVSAEAGNVALLATFVPRLPGRSSSIDSGREMYGDVFYLFSRIKLR